MYELKRFDAFVVERRIRSAEICVLQGQRGKATSILEETMDVLNRSISDLQGVWKEDIVQLLFEMSMMVACGVMNLSPIIRKMQDIVDMNNWYSSRDRWSKIAAYRIAHNMDEMHIGELAGLPNDILHKIGKILTSEID
jgi:hypothetical protein